ESDEQLQILAREGAHLQPVVDNNGADNLSARAQRSTHDRTQAEGADALPGGKALIFLGIASQYRLALLDDVLDDSVAELGQGVPNRLLIDAARDDRFQPAAQRIDEHDEGPFRTRKLDERIHDLVQ